MSLRKTLFIAISVAVISVLLISNLTSASAIVTGNNQRVSYNYDGSQIRYQHSTQALISGDGKQIAYHSASSSILPGGSGSVVRNIASGVSVRINSSTAGVVTNPTGDILDNISYTGRYVLFRSYATNLIDGITISSGPYKLYIRDTVEGTTKLITQNPDTGEVANGTSLSSLGVSSDGRFIAFASNSTNLVSGVTDGNPHLYMLDRSNNTLSVIDRKADGSLGTSAWVPSGGMSCDGSILAFQYGSNLIVGTPDTNHVDVYILDRRGDTPHLTNLTAGTSRASTTPTVSCNGDYIGLNTQSEDLDPTVTAVYSGKNRPYIYDRVNDRFYFAAVNPSGMAISGAACPTANNPCIWVSDKGQGVFSSKDTNLPGANGNQMVYIRDIESPSAELVSRDASGNSGDQDSQVPRISADGRIVSYQSGASNLVSGDTNDRWDIFISQVGY